MYDKLPEVIKRREDEERRAQYNKNRLLLKLFDKVSTRPLSISSWISYNILSSWYVGASTWQSGRVADIRGGERAVGRLPIISPLPFVMHNS